MVAQLLYARRSLTDGIESTMDRLSDIREAGPKGFDSRMNGMISKNEQMVMDMLDRGTELDAVDVMRLHASLVVRLGLQEWARRRIERDLAIERGE